jgi:hypothetical protein
MVGSKVVVPEKLDPVNVRWCVSRAVVVGLQDVLGATKKHPVAAPETGIVVPKAGRMNALAANSDPKSNLLNI